MKDDEHSGEALIPASRAGLSTLRSSSLIARARADLQHIEDAADWLCRGISLLADAADATCSSTPVNLYASAPPAPSRRPEEPQLEVARRPNTLHTAAFLCFKRGHELDPTNPELLYRLARSYERGIAVAADEQMALSLYRRAATLGHAAAMRAVGDVHAQISFACLPENWSEAAQWYKRAAELGDETAIWMIFSCYDSGHGVAQDRTEAARWLRTLAEQGNEDAREALNAGGLYGAGDQPAQ